MSKSPWVTSLEASKKLQVSENTLRHWREIGYLKPGTHWRSAPESTSSAWKPEVIYHLNWCTEVMDYWREQDARIVDLAS